VSLNSSDFVRKLKPVNDKDMLLWDYASRTLTGRLPPLFWYAGAAFDMKPLISFYEGRFPLEIQRRIYHQIQPILTDYSLKILKALKSVYGNLFCWQSCDSKTNMSGWPWNQLRRIQVKQIVPLSFFSRTEVENIRRQYPNYHHTVTTSVIPDDSWHFCYLEVIADGYSISLIYGLIENLVFWKEIVEKYGLIIDAFCALRVAGKSGSWDYTHSPSKGKLFKAIQESPCREQRPKVWIADNCEELREIWEEIDPHGGGFYGTMHYFLTQNLKTIKVIYKNGRRVMYTYDKYPLEYYLAKACYEDMYNDVRNILIKHPAIDVNATVIHNGKRGRGTPLVLTGSVKIARLLVEHGADVNHPAYITWLRVTPLDSAEFELSKHYRKGGDREVYGSEHEARALVDYLKSLGAVRSSRKEELKP